ncbi:hypothetical protein [Propionivibrio sp.]|uniref:hypothetical protein n=1 Tax=Propionivibrio sp. TaxID=2212460 RepID=UPI002634C777|nr:hypothetical protein [Propionivibrio sp.]
MKPAFGYNDVVRVQSTASYEARPGEKAWIVGVFETRPEGGYFDKFPEGVVYSVEFEDGSSTEIHEADLRIDNGSDYSGTI